ncbi:MAG: metal-dependent hydrolase [Vicinamibacteraceae bacterium]
MPSPLGHALAGVTLGLMARGAAHPDESTVAPAGSRAVRRGQARDPRWRRAATFAMLGVLPDVDLLFGVHSTYTHSIGAVAIVFTGAWLILRRQLPAATSTSSRSTPWLRMAGPRGRLACAVALAYGSHLLLDWLGHDPMPPRGITALWPFSTAYYEADLHLFMPISRRYWLDAFWRHNLMAVARELPLLVPCAVLAWWWAGRRIQDSGFGIQDSGNRIRETGNREQGTENGKQDSGNRPA